MATTESIAKVINLAAKTGLFFAKADGIYSDKEEAFINKFIHKLSAIGPVDEVKGNLESLLDKDITLDEIVAETNSLLADFNGLEKALICGTLVQFVKRVIDADGEQAEIEKKNFEAWKAAIK